MTISPVTTRSPFVPAQLPAPPPLEGRGLLLSERLSFWATHCGSRTALRFADYSTVRSGVVLPLTYAQLELRVSAVAAVLRRSVRRGDRVAVMAPQGLEFVVGFLAALRAGVVAVPLFPPDLPGHGDRLRAVLADCRPALVLATGANAAATADLVGPQVPVVAVDEVADAEAAHWTPVVVDPDDTAYLQYTSGSTRTPAGVVITHANVVRNAHQAITALQAPSDTLVVTWLPLFHDMGLLFALGGVLVSGFPSLVMDPVAFLMKPVRWLEHLSGQTYGVTAAPNFAYDYAARRVTPEQAAALDLRGVRVMVNGAEPIAPATLERFAAAFAGAGLDPRVLVPSYGLAEATVYVCGGRRPQGPVTTTFDARALSQGRAVPPTDTTAPTQTLVSCGRPQGQRVVVADPATGTRLPPDRVGEIWVHGPNVGQGYWGRPEQTAEVFGQVLVGAGELPAHGWLRTGDLGLLHDDDLYVTGRIKDLMILDGRNHYPQDVEATVEAASDVVARHRSVAFSVPDGDREAVVVVAEVSRHRQDGDHDPDAVRAALSAAVSRRHGLPVADVVLVEPDAVPRTTSGKLARAACCALYLAGGLRQVGAGRTARQARQA